MNCLLDTHAFLWALFSPEKLSESATKSIKTTENDVAVSVVTFWEISLKYALSKIELIGVTPDELPEIASHAGFLILPVRPIEAATFHKLPRLAHKDPFDRFIIWQAILNKMTLVSVDTQLNAYRDLGLRILW